MTKNYHQAKGKRLFAVNVEKLPTRKANETLLRKFEFQELPPQTIDLLRTSSFPL